MPARRVLRAYAHGRPGAWEAICVDFDIAVQGASFDEVRALIDEALVTYVADAVREGPRNARRLLSRRAPFWVSLFWGLGFLAHLRGGDGRGDLRAGFDIPCPA